MTKDEQQPKAKKVSFYEQRGETSRFIDAEIDEDGDLSVSGQDVGKAPASSGATRTMSSGFTCGASRVVRADPQCAR